MKRLVALRAVSELNLGLTGFLSVLPLGFLSTRKEEMVIHQFQKTAENTRAL